MNQAELSAGTIEYQDTGAGPPLVFLHGLLMDASLWEDVITSLSPAFRCLAPTLPLGAHRIPMRPDADLSLPAIAGLVTEFLDRLDLHDVTLIGNDTGGALVQLLMAAPAPRVSRVVLASCDAFDNFPPGLTGRALFLAGRLPPALFGLFMQQMRLRPVRRLPVAFGWLTKRGDAATARWLRPVLTQPEIRRDTVRTLRAAASGHRPADPGRRDHDRLPAPGPDRLGQPGPRDAARARPPPGRAAARQRAGRGGRQLHAHPPGPARPPGSGHPRLRPQPGRQQQGQPITNHPTGRSPAASPDSVITNEPGPG